MPRLLSKPLSKTFEIDDWTVSIHQLTEGDYIDLKDLEGGTTELYNSDLSFKGYHNDMNNRRWERRAVYKTMGDCTLAWEDTGEAIFDTKDGYVKKALGEAGFNRNWDLLPPEIAAEIIKKFYEVNIKKGESKAT